jgi:hypothetical protein
MSQYFLAPHVFLCVTDDHAVLLDLKRDKYIGVGRAQAHVLQQCIRGWPQPAAPGVERAEAASAEAVIGKMLASGLITADATRGRDAVPVSLPTPQSTLSELAPTPGRDLFDTRPRIRAGHVLNFIMACTAARLSLRFRSIGSIVAKARARKARNARRGPAVDLEAARRHVAAYVYLRPLLFTAKDACLFDALALTHFLARYRIFATWVFGIQTGPFAAHSWVQHDDVVLNDTPDNVRRYAPILAI